MKTKKFIVYWDADSAKISESVVELSDSKFREVLGLDTTVIKAPYVYKLSTSAKLKLIGAIGSSEERSYYATLEWRDVPETDAERLEVIKTYIRSARAIFEPNDSEVSKWLKTKCNAEWLFEKHMKENNLLLAIEELHVITQCFYGRPLGDVNFTRILNEARKLALAGC